MKMLHSWIPFKAMPSSERHTGSSETDLITVHDQTRLFVHKTLHSFLLLTLIQSREQNRQKNKRSLVIFSVLSEGLSSHVRVAGLAGQASPSQVDS